ncbi:MAG: cytochrome-c peroxidase, partial [Gammaproteobacteria bacterium]
PTIWNTAFLSSFFWDGRATTLEQQMMGPLYSPEEMNSTEEGMLVKLNQSNEYRRLFAEAFPSTSIAGTFTDSKPTDSKSPEILVAQVYIAIAAFESSLISLNSRYDQYAHGYHQALNETEVKGLNVFRSFVARCAECHTPPLFTNQQIAVIGTPETEGLEFDVGAEKTFSEATLRGGFKVPTLRNIAKSAPYMHSGRFETLREAVEFYTKGRGHAVPEDQELLIHWHIWEPDLSDTELDELVAFLQTLTDESFKPQIPKRVPSGLPPINNKEHKLVLLTGE